MSKVKGFSGPKPEIRVPIPVERLEQIATTAPRLEVLLGEILAHKLSPRCYGMFKKLAHMEPIFRLSYNLKVVIGQLCDKDVTNVLTDGLTEDERDVLIEADASGMPLEARRTAHSLLNIESRIRLIESFNGIFRDMRTRSNHVLDSKPLDV